MNHFPPVIGAGLVIVLILLVFHFVGNKCPRCGSRRWEMDDNDTLIGVCKNCGFHYPLVK